MYQKVTPIKIYVKNNKYNCTNRNLCLKKKVLKIPNQPYLQSADTHIYIYTFVSASILKIGFQALINSLVC